jgi:hypothetical protein
VFTYGLDGMIHKLAVGTGAESKHSGFPKPVTLKPTIERVAGGLTIARDQHRTVRIYAATSSAGDSGDYQGHVVAYNLRTGEQGVFNVLCSDQQKLLGLNECPWTGGGVWATGGVRYSPDDNRIYVATGNGLFNPDPAGAGYWGDSLLGLDPSLEKVVSSFTPPNYVDRMLHDKDLGASGPMIVAARNGSGVSHLALQAGKFGGIKVIDRDHGSVGSVGGARVIRNPGGDAEVGAPFARWTNPTDHSLWVFFSDDHAISGFELVPRAKSTALALRWTRTAASTSEWNNSMQRRRCSRTTSFFSSEGESLRHWIRRRVICGGPMPR